MPDKPPFDPQRWAMLLLGVLIVTPSLIVLAMTLHCLVSLDNECWVTVTKGMFRDWLVEIVPVLVAIIMTGRNKQQ